MKQIVYRERANGKTEYWTYAENRKIYLSASQVERLHKQGEAKIVKISH